jgi:broad specificity phosphatase PhoE
MTTIDWRIPPSMHEHLAELPTDRPVAMLIRHSVRDPLPPGEAGYQLPITPVGKRLARELGSVLGPRLRSLHASPLVRTMQTAAELARGAGLTLPTVQDRHLGDPGVFVLDDDLAGESWKARGHEAVMEHLVGGEAPLPGLAAADPAARFLVQHMLTVGAGAAGIHAFVTHDSLVTATAARLLGERLEPADWPWYLEAAFFWRSTAGVVVRYRGRSGARAGALCSLADADVIEFARREIAATVGLDCPARFFLSGGAFKSLLTGRAPSDLDYWAPTTTDREALVASLRHRGAEPLPRRPYSDGWLVGNRVVEVAHKVKPPTLEARHARFDLALSAIGVEHMSGRSWRAVVHPLAHESVLNQEIMVLWPLANPRHVLSTIERARRYARELCYYLPAPVEASLWRAVEESSPQDRQGLVRRFLRVARHEQGVAEDLVARRLGAPGDDSKFLDSAPYVPGGGQ